MSMLKSIFFSIIIVFLFVFKSFAQPIRDTVVWCAGIYVSPDYNYRMVETDDPDLKYTASQLDDFEIPKAGITIGATISRKLIKDKLHLQLGLSFANKGYKTNTQNDTVFNMYGEILNISDFYNVYRYYSLNVPVMLKYKVFNIGNVSFNLGLGIAPDISLGKNVISVYSKKSIMSNISKAERNFNLDAIANMSIRFPISDEVLIELEPTYRQSLHYPEYNNDIVFKRYFYSAGFAIHIIYRLFEDSSIYKYEEEIEGELE